ncbi:MAG TPA: hypothetical protein VGC77_20910 [Rhodopseudomonas sp.]|uniref:hypothetical protein n=1 Tax=Rhodopseudomonas sp. TaxID=1078 RepID=UPI002ED9A184
MTGFINGAVEALVRDLRATISSSPEFSHNDDIIDAFAAFETSCRIRPAIVDYVDSKVATADNDTCFSDKQLQLLMLSVIARSSSTYGTIPGVVSHLALIGEHDDAAILNENAKNETGDRRNTPHPVLLYDCFKVIGEAFSIPYLTPASYHMLRLILIGRSLCPERDLSSVAGVKQYLLEQDLYVPRHTDADVRVALHYTDLSKADISLLHSDILKMESRMQDGAAAPSDRNPYDKSWLAVRRLELAMREASSVDEHDTQRLSYIGSWGRVVDHLADNIPTAHHRRARAWVEAHNDEIAGQAVGWSGAAEEGHAEDAREQAVQMMTTVRPATFAAALREVTLLNNLRLAFWIRVVDDLNSLEAEDAPQPALDGPFFGERPRPPIAAAIG